MHITFPFVNEETLLYATSKVLSNVQPKVPCICFEHAFFEPQQCDLYTTLQSPFSLIISKVCKKLRKITNIFICSNCPDSSLEIRYRNWGANQTTRWKTAVARLPFRMLFHAYHRLISLINRRINSATHLLKQVWLATDGRNCKNNVRTATTRKRGQTSVCLQIKSATPNESNELLAL